MDELLKKESLGKKIQKLRMEQNKSQEDLAKALEKSRVAVSDIERGKTDLSVKDLTAIAKFLNVSIDDLLDDTVPSIVLPTYKFSHHRAERGMDNDDMLRMKRAREVFREEARKRAKEQNS